MNWLTEFEEGILILNRFHFRKVVNVISRAICISKFIVESVCYFLQENEYELLIILPLSDCHVYYSLSRNKAIGTDIVRCIRVTSHHQINGQDLLELMVFDVDGALYLLVEILTLLQQLSCIYLKALTLFWGRAIVCFTENEAIRGSSDKTSLEHYKWRIVGNYKWFLKLINYWIIKIVFIIKARDHNLGKSLFIVFQIFFSILLSIGHYCPVAA